MAISVDWPNKTVSVHQTDSELSHVSGTFYTADSDAIRLAVKALEDDSTGMAWPRVMNHNTEVGPIAGVTYARTIEIINGYKIQFLPDSQWTVKVEGSNNNFHDVGGNILIQNQVQVIPSNTAGYIVVETGVSGLTAAESQALVDIDSNVDGLVVDVAALDVKVSSLLSAQNLTNEQAEAEHTTDPDTGKIVLRNWDTIHRWEADAWEDANQTIRYRGRGLESVGQLVEVDWPYTIMPMTPIDMYGNMKDIDAGNSDGLPDELFDGDDGTWINSTITTSSESSAAVAASYSLPLETLHGHKVVARYKGQTRAILEDTPLGETDNNIVVASWSTGPSTPEDHFSVPTGADTGDWQEYIAELSPIAVQQMHDEGVTVMVFHRATTGWSGSDTLVVATIEWRIPNMTTDLWP